MGKAQEKNMPDGNDRSFVKEQTTDVDIKTMLFASNPLLGTSAAGIDADVKAFLAFVEEQKKKM